ncbi:MAG: hypothetical protein WC227_00490 [Patescibacteria group bacterium]|jgi:type IV secretory pathway VirB4 component
MAFSTQQQIEIAGIKDGIIIMKDGTYRVILEVTATNFALKSEMEQNSLIMQYQSFLNSLHFTIEITIRSKRLDLAPYLTKMKALGDKQPSELIRELSADYVDFIGKLVTIANIMKKSFFVTIAYSPISVKQVGLFNMLFGQKTQKFDHLKISDVDFKNATEKLLENAGIVASGLGSMGLHCFQLSTEQIIELFYQIYNPAESTKERLTDAEMLASQVVSTKKAPADGKVPEIDGITPMLIDNTHIVTAQMQQEAEQRRQATEMENMNAPAGTQVPQTAATEQAGASKAPELNELDVATVNTSASTPTTNSPLDNLSKDDDGPEPKPTT